MTTDETIAALDRGEVRVAEPVGDDWVVHPEVQEAAVIGVPSFFEYRDKIPLKTGY